ncbi:hypothetical protein M378DRAFT_160172 [Amanita muscaria Koide BX008]|uniref:Uncharacterized protein n=1 Tax=Amanita muscaria (strain Koide BX008) TaxID=946122 RepID=A0A0C2TJJ6_AMAMK|nr:hypothetical protein M378DRAFT_160172 [Amanita muscaria Koide BX008]
MVVLGTRHTRRHPINAFLATSSRNADADAQGYYQGLSEKRRLQQKNHTRSLSATETVSDDSHAR